jgi:hypothetical protein
VSSAAGAGQTERQLQLCGGGVWVGYGDDEMIETEQPRAEIVAIRPSTVKGMRRIPSLRLRFEDHHSEGSRS